MAIINNFPHVKVTVRVDGTDLVEYDDPTPPPPAPPRSPSSPPRKPGAQQQQQQQQQQRKWIESVAGAEFSVHASVSADYPWVGGKSSSENIRGGAEGLRFTTVVDGLDELTGRVISPDEAPQAGEDGRRWREFTEGRYSTDEKNGKEYVRRCRFRPVTTRDASKQSGVEDSGCEIGTIRVEVHRGRVGRRGRPGPLDDPDPHRPSTPPVVYEDKEGAMVSHGVSFQPMQLEEPYEKGYVDFRCAAGDADPIAVFEFRYRLREDLVAMGILVEAGLSVATPPCIQETKRTPAGSIATGCRIAKKEPGLHARVPPPLKRETELPLRLLKTAEDVKTEAGSKRAGTLEEIKEDLKRVKTFEGLKEDEDPGPKRTRISAAIQEESGSSRAVGTGSPGLPADGTHQQKRLRRSPQVPDDDAVIVLAASRVRTENPVIDLTTSRERIEDPVIDLTWDWEYA